MDPQKPTVGRIVHYTPPESDGRKGAPYPAVITHVFGDTCVNLHVFDDGSFPLHVPGTEAHKPTSVNLGTGPRSWSWPPR